MRGLTKKIYYHHFKNHYEILFGFLDYPLFHQFYPQNYLHVSSHFHFDAINYPMYDKRDICSNHCVKSHFAIFLSLYHL
jgi:hypothetical protein